MGLPIRAQRYATGKKRSLRAGPGDQEIHGILRRAEPDNSVQRGRRTAGAENPEARANESRNPEAGGDSRGPAERLGDVSQETRGDPRKSRCLTPRYCCE